MHFVLSPMFSSLCEEVKNMEEKDLGPRGTLRLVRLVPLTPGREEVG